MSQDHGFGFGLFNDTLVSVRTFGVMYGHTFLKLANHQIRHQATHKVGCQTGDCIWSLYSSSGVCVGIYGLTYSLYRPRESQEHEMRGSRGHGFEPYLDCILLSKLH